MRKALYCLLAAALLPGGYLTGFSEVLAQTKAPLRYDTRAEILANTEKAGGMYYMYDENLPPLPSAPKGYKAFYISHFGRHGARYALSTKLYGDLLDLFSKAHAEGKLTEAGERFHGQYLRFYPEIALRAGELSEKGQGQLRRMADRMVRNYPGVFKGDTHAEVSATNTHRVLLSMFSFLDQLRTDDRTFAFSMAAGSLHTHYLLPVSPGNPDYVKPSPKSPEAEAAMAKMNGKVAARTIAGRLFNDLDYLEKTCGINDFCKALWEFVIDLPCIDEEIPSGFREVFTPEEYLQNWEAENYFFYQRYGSCPLTTPTLQLLSSASLEDVLLRADEDMASGGAVDLRLRFTHDSCFLPLLGFMEINSNGAAVEDPEAVKDYWRTFDVPMACNLQFIFFRSRKDPRILVRVLLNERSVVLPLDPVSPSFYDWEALKAYYRPRIQEAKDRLK